MIKDFCSIGSTWNQNGWLKWGILGLFGLLFLTLLTRCSPIENDLGEKTQTLLGEKNMSWAKTSLDGRDVTLTGEAPNEGARDSAIELTQNVYGVRTVNHDEITLKQWSSSTFNLKRDGEQVVLTGSMPDEASIDAAVSQAHSLYGDINVTNKLEVSDSASTPAWLAGTTGMMAALMTTRNLAMNVSDDKVEISGEVETEAEKAKLIADAQASYGDTFSESIKVVKTRPTAEELAAIAAAKIAEEERIANEARMIAEAEAARLAKEAEDARLLAEAEAARLAEEERLAAEVESARLAEEARLAEIAAEKQRLADIEAAKIKIAQAEAAFLASCQSEFEQILGNNPNIFNKDSFMISGSSYPALGMLAQKINYCSDILHAKNQYIDVSTHAGEAETSPLSASISQKRIHSAISYLEVMNGAHPGLLRPSSGKTAENTPSNSQLHFNISE
jgi:osmotically-inducible protein OsmY